MLFLSQYDKTVKYRKGSLVANADALSRLPTKEETNIECENINFFNITGKMSINHEKISKETQNDEYLSKILKYVKNDWPKIIEDKI